MVTPRFARQVVLGRWFMVFSAVMILSASGATFIFGMYSKVLKTSLGYDQRTLNTLAFFKDLGYNVGILAGLINEVTPPWVGLSIGAALNLFGYLMIYLAVDGRTARPPVWLMCIYICVGANSQSFTNTCALVTCVKNFPESRGITLGLLKSFTGLSGAIFAQLYLAIYGDNAKSLVLLIAWLPVTVSILFGHAVRIMPHPRNSSTSTATTNSAFYRFLYISIALAGFLLVMIVVQQRINFSHAAYAVSGAAVLLLLFLPLTVVVKQEYMILNELEESLQEPPTLTIEEPAALQMVEQEQQNATVEKDAELPQQQLASSSSSLRSCLKHMFTPPPRGEDYTILQALVSVDMLLLFMATICGAGGTLTAIDNMGQIGQSLGYPAKTINTFVSLISIWNYAGRIVSGFTSEILLSRYKFPRTLMVTMVLLLSCVGHLLIAFGVPQSLYLASVLVGFCFGALWPLVYAIISEIFGLKYYSTLYNFGTVASPIGAYLLNVRVSGYFYDVEAAKQHGGTLAGVDKTCMGVECFKKSFLIVTGVTVLGMVVSLVLVWRTRKFYKGDIYARFRDNASAKVLPAGISIASEGQPRKEAE
ncbi:protein NUCLEAR FUSION DEFECTIVE 4 [Setaria italica]|nr:protein NUCLEAR FUSION DEFECTIVE 4 [Setaria italica]